MEQFNSTLSLIGTVVITIAATLGIGNLLLAMYQRWAGRRDKRNALHDSNQAAELDHDDKFQQRLLHRVEMLEGEIQKMQAEQVAQARIHTKLELENVALKKETNAQESELKRLRERDAERLERIRHLEEQVSELSAAVDILNRQSLLDAEGMKALMASNDVIQGAIKRLGFVPTGEPTDADNEAVQRLKEIRDASQEIAKVVGG